ncbi:MAG: DUF1570 domain-containing protein [Planctomycetota bacterium]
MILWSRVKTFTVICLLWVGALALAGEQLAGMTRVASEDIIVQTCRDQAYTLKITKMLATLQREFCQRFQATTISGRFENIIFKDKSDYHSYCVSRKIANFPDRGAYFSAQKAVLLYFEGQPEEVLQRNLIHEVTHHFTRIVYGVMPTWFEEGVAMYFQESDYNRSPVILGVVDQQISGNVKGALEQKRLLSVDALLKLEYKAYHVSDIGRERLHYDQSWALVHFFVHASEKLKPADATGRARVAAYRPKFLNFMAEARKTRTKPEVSWKKTMGDLPMESLEKDFQEYVHLLPGELIDPNLLVNKWPNGKKKFEGELKDNRVNGKVTYWYENGQMQSTGTMRDGQWHGIITFWTKNGKLMETLEYYNGQQVENVVP